MNDANEKLIEELNSAGFPVTSVSELYGRKFDYRDAISILIKWLPLVSNPKEKEEIVRALSVKWGRPTAAVPLIAEFRTVRDESGLGLRWVIANALSVVADDSVLEEIERLIRSREFGRSREMLALALARMKNPKVGQILLDMLDDDEVVGHALIAIRKHKIQAARNPVQALLHHHSRWIRNEAKKTLNAIKASGSDDAMLSDGGRH